MNATCQTSHDQMHGDGRFYPNVQPLPRGLENSPAQLIVPFPLRRRVSTKPSKGTTKFSWARAQDFMNQLLGCIDVDDLSRGSLKNRILELQEMASDKNWDGEGAAPLDQVTVSHATQFVDCLPVGLPRPDVDVSPHGTIDLEWVLSRQAMLSVSICPDNTIAFAARFPGERIRSSTDWSKAIPDSLMVAIKRLQQECDMVCF